MLSFVDNLSDGQFAAVFLIAILATLYVVGEFDAWAARKVAQHRARTFTADHARERVGVPLAGASRVHGPSRDNDATPLSRATPRQPLAPSITPTRPGGRGKAASSLPRIVPSGGVVSRRER